MLNLSKESSAINLTKNVPNVTKFKVGLAWDEMKSGKSDLDSSVVVMKDGAFSGMAYYNNLDIAGVHHNGDNRTGAGDGDDETIDIDLNAVDGDEVFAVITSYMSGEFGASNNAVAHIYKDGETDPLIECKLADEAAFGTALNLVRFFKEDGEWKFENVSESIGDSSNGLQDVQRYFNA